MYFTQLLVVTLDFTRQYNVEPRMYTCKVVNKLVKRGEQRFTFSTSVLNYFNYLYAYEICPSFL